MNNRPYATPADLYLANLSAGSQGMRSCLDTIAGILTGLPVDEPGDTDSYPWHELTYRETMTVRLALADRYRPATVNKMLSALRGVLKQAWRLGLMDAEAYRRAADVENLRCSNLLSPRALDGDEIARLFPTCANAPPRGDPRRHSPRHLPRRRSGICRTGALEVELHLRVLERLDAGRRRFLWRGGRSSGTSSPPGHTRDGLRGCSPRCDSSTPWAHGSSPRAWLRREPGPPTKTTHAERG